MATQDFFNGGFIGKMGDTIGQRWKSKRVIKAYAKPSNPKTPAQLKARAEFKIAIETAQQGMGYTGHSGLLDTSHLNEFQVRTSLALKAKNTENPRFYGVFLTPEQGNEPTDYLLCIEAAIHFEKFRVILCRPSAGYRRPQRQVLYILGDESLAKRNQLYLFEPTDFVDIGNGIFATETMDLRESLLEFKDAKFAALWDVGKFPDTAARHWNLLSGGIGRFDCYWLARLLNTIPFLRNLWGTNLTDAQTACMQAQPIDNANETWWPLKAVFMPSGAKDRAVKILNVVWSGEEGLFEIKTECAASTSTSRLTIVMAISIFRVADFPEYQLFETHVNITSNKDTRYSVIEAPIPTGNISELVFTARAYLHVLSTGAPQGFSDGYSDSWYPYERLKK